MDAFSSGSSPLGLGNRVRLRLVAARRAGKLVRQAKLDRIVFSKPPALPTPNTFVGSRAEPTSSYPFTRFRAVDQDRTGSLFNPLALGAVLTG